jgi:Transcription factor WhiB
MDDPPLLAALLLGSEAHADQAWRRDARCRGADPELFMPARGENVEAARAFCADCPVKLECLEFAMSLSELRCQGVWVARLLGRVDARIGVGSARWSYSPSSTLHHICTTTGSQTRSLTVTCGQPEMGSDLRNYTNVLMSALCRYAFTRQRSLVRNQ